MSFSKLYSFLFLVLLMPFFLVAQSNEVTIKIDYDWTCEFCAGKGFNSTLYSGPEGALFEFSEKLLGPSNTGSESVIIDTATRLMKYNSRSDSIFQMGFMRSIDSNGVLICEKRLAINWLLVDSTKEIDGHICRLAIGEFRGREYSAWYDPEIRVNHGPWKLHGLPGAIIYAVDSTKELAFKAISIDTVGSFKFPELPSLTKVSRELYRRKREEVYDRMANLKPKEGSGVTYNIVVTRNHFEYE